MIDEEIVTNCLKCRLLGNAIPNMETENESVLLFVYLALENTPAADDDLLSKISKFNGTRFVFIIE